MAKLVYVYHKILKTFLIVKQRCAFKIDTASIVTGIESRLLLDHLDPRKIFLGM